MESQRANNATPSRINREGVEAGLRVTAIAGNVDGQARMVRGLSSQGTVVAIRRTWGVSRIFGISHQGWGATVELPQGS